MAESNPISPSDVGTYFVRQNALKGPFSSSNAKMQIASILPLKRNGKSHPKLITAVTSTANEKWSDEVPKVHNNVSSIE